MTKRTRLIILLVCVVCFFVIAPVLVFYSMGYRFDFDKMKITLTGGIYVRTFPAADQITVDSKISQKPGFLTNYVFVQSLLPGDSHTVLVKKNNYYDYYKTIPVQEKEVTKLENIILFKKTTNFSNLYDKVDYFSVSPNNQNIITSSSGVNNITFNYSSLSSKTPLQTFSINQIGLPGQGKILEIKWSNDSNKALINYNNNIYYLFDTTLKKPTATRLSYLDKNAQQISFNPQDSKQLFFVKNSSLYSVISGKTLILIKNLLVYNVQNNNIIWISSDGIIYNSDISGKLISALSDKKITQKGKLQLLNFSGKIFVQNGDNLVYFNLDKKTFEDVNPPITNYKILSTTDSNNYLNLVFWNQNKIYFYSFSDKKMHQLFSGYEITDCQWVNNNYIIFAQQNKIIISETDYRGEINAVTLPSTVIIKSDPNISIEIKAPKIYFNQQDGKLYILTNNTLLSSDKITP